MISLRYRSVKHLTKLKKHRYNSLFIEEKLPNKEEKTHRIAIWVKMQLSKSE